MLIHIQVQDYVFNTVHLEFWVQLPLLIYTEIQPHILALLSASHPTHGQISKQDYASQPVQMTLFLPIPKISI